MGRSVAIVLLVICSTANVFPQQKKSLRVAVSTPYPDYLSLNEVKDIAKQQAFNKALNQSGAEIEMQRQSESLYASVNDSISYDYYFLQFSSAQKVGITDFQILKQVERTKADTRTLETEMEVVLKSYQSTPDLSFTLDMEVPQKIFRDGEALSLNITPNKEGFLHIFYSDGLEVFCLFPNELEKENYFLSKVKYAFPRNQFVSYLMEATDTEQSFLFSVYTKKEIAFNDSYPFDSFFNELAKIELDQKFIHRVPLKILK